MGLVDDSQNLRTEEGTLEHRPVLGNLERRRQVVQLRIGRKHPAQLLDHRLEGVARGTTVREYLQHLDLARRHIRALGGVDQEVVSARGPFVRGVSQGGGAERQQCGENRASEHGMRLSSPCSYVWIVLRRASGAQADAPINEVS